MVNMRQVDVAVIGGGTAGLAAYRAAKAARAAAVLIERGPFGTTCARVGCMPSKLLIAAAEAAHDARAAEPFGVFADVRVDGKAVMDRVRRERDRFVSFVNEGVDAIALGDKLLGQARFAAPGVLSVTTTSGDVRVVAKSVVIATGSSPFVPPAFQTVRDRLVVNDDVFSWDELPESIAVFGAGIVGLELGQALHRLGVRVRIFGRGGALGPLRDPAVHAAARAAFEAELALDVDARVLHLGRDERGVVVRWVSAAGAIQEETFAYALVAAGRKPNLTQLGLEHAGVVLDDRGAPAFDRFTLQCGDAPVFVAGDANDDATLLHEAADEGAIAGRNAALYPNVTPARRRSPLAVVFTDPQLAIVGDAYPAMESRTDVVRGTVSFALQGRSRVMLRNKGMLALYAEASTGRLLGAEIAGPRAEHLAHLLAWSHQQGLTVSQMLEMPFYHPVVEEGLRTALRDADGQLRQVR